MKSKTIGRIKAAALSVAMCLQLAVPSVDVEAAQTFYDNKTGYEDGFDYELWKDYGSTSMTIKGGGNFECWWENIGNVLFRKGKKFDCTQTYQQIGNMSINFGVDYQPNGNSYLCVYGWTRNHLLDYYIVESWGSWRPPGANSKGQITVDGGTYDVYETTRVNQPSIDGNTTFQQYWSVRTSKRNSGTISVSEHFQAWERMGMKMGNIYEVAFNVEGYQSSGWADVYKNELTIGGSISSGGNNGGSGSGDNSNSAAPGTAQGTRVECENMTISGQYAGKISSPFDGVALYANDESVSYTQNFTSGTHDFTLSGASNGDNLAKVDLYIGGENKGTFYYGDANVAEYTIEGVSHGTGNQKIELKVTADDGTWDAFIDALIISAAGTAGAGSNTGNSGSNNNNNNNAQPTGKMVALTFDDGPSSTTPYVLDVLERYDAKATFFLIGQQVNSDTMSIMQRQVEMGCELANHSYTHEDMGNMSANDVKNQIQWTSSAIKNTVGVDVKFFRAPYLSTSNTMFQNVGLTFIQGIDTKDYDSNTSVNQRVSNVLNNVSDGSIILMHDFQGNNATVEALPRIIEGLQSQGYTLVTLSELFEYKGVNPNQNYKVWSNVYN